MPDLYLTIAEQQDAVLDAISASMDARAGEAATQEICKDYMSRLPRPGKRVLEVGCGNGATTAMLLEHLRPSEHVGVDPAQGLIDRAVARYADRPEVSFALGNASDTGQEAGVFDVVVVHTVFSHLADPDKALHEALRVLRPGGTLAVFDGDYATITVALYDGDPLQAAVDAVHRNAVHDPYIMRKLPRMARKAGFLDGETRAHGYMQTEKPEYLVSLLARGLAAAVNAGEFGPEIAEGFNREAAARVTDGTFYGAILFVSLIARKPG